jgi:hypothetical protein
MFATLQEALVREEDVNDKIFVVQTTQVSTGWGKD